MSTRTERSNPYVGLRPFFAADSLYFFGREQQTAELLEILHQNRFLGIVGSSGSGKSSLVRAGLIPSLLAGFLAQDRDRWRIVEMKPGDTPIGNLAAALLKATGKTVTQQARAELEELIHDEHTDAVVDFLTPLNEENANVFLLVDQFEEIFAFRGDQEDDAVKSDDPARRKERARRRSEAASFVDLLMKLAERREVPVYVALTMRTDFLGDCDVFYGFPEALNRGRYLVPRMTRPQLQDAIEAPATLMGARIAPRLLDHVLNALGDRFDRLPVLQHALLRTWDKWQKSGRMGAIDLVHFEEMAGGLEWALDQDAEEALQGLDEEVTSRIFKRLTDTDVSLRRIRSPARISELMAVAGAKREVVDGIIRRFEEDNRNFVFRSDDGKPDDQRVDISHESLIRQWDRLRDWVDDEKRSRDQYRELVTRAGKKPRTLLRDPELQTFVDWRENSKPSSGWAARYSANEAEFALALGYLDESVDGRVSYQSEVELGRRYREFAQAIAGLSFVLFVNAMALRYVNTPLLDALTSKEGMSQFVEETGTSLFQAFKDVWRIAVVPVVFLALLEIGRRIHRQVVGPGILRQVHATGGRDPGKGREDAVVACNAVYASGLRRVGAYLMDCLLFFPMAWGAGTFIVRPLSVLTPPFAGNNTQVFLLLAACFIIGWLYDALQIASGRQATLGMRAFGVFRTDLYGQRLSFWRASLWYVAKLLSLLPLGLGYALQPFTSRRQTLHDRIAGSVVLRRRVADVAPPVPVRVPSGERVAVVALYATAALVAVYMRLRPDPLEIVSVQLNVKSDSVITINEQGESLAGYRLVLRNGDTVADDSAARALRLMNGILWLRTSDTNVVGVHLEDEISGAFKLKGGKEGLAKIWVVLQSTDSDSLVSRDTASVRVLGASELLRNAIDAYYLWEERVKSDVEPDSAIRAGLEKLEKDYGKALRDSYGMGHDLDQLRTGINDLMAASAEAEQLLEPGSGANPNSLVSVLNAYVELANTYRGGHSPLFERYNSRLKELLNTGDGRVLTYGVCKAPCDSDQRRDTQFNTGDNVVIRLRYVLKEPGPVYIEWRRDGATQARRQYSVQPSPAGYRLWDQKNVSGEGEWEVRVLNEEERPVESHKFRVRK